VSLREWLSNGWLVVHKTGHEEIDNLLNLAERDLADCRAPSLSSDWRLAIAYNAALQLATAALAAAGYRAASEAHHYRVIQSLTHTVGADTELVLQLDQFRKKRNISGYDRAGAVSEREAKEMLALAERLRRDIRNWLRAIHPELIDKQ
jgi:hypothetical protein